MNLWFLNVESRRRVSGSRSSVSLARRKFRQKQTSAAVESLEPRFALAAIGGGITRTWLAASVDTTPPAVRSLTPPKSQTYSTDSTLSFKVNFTERVFVTGSPTLPITIGDSVRHALWNGKGSGSKSLVFTTTVQSGDFAPAGVQVSGPIGLSGGATIRDKAENALIPTASIAFPKARVDAVGPRAVEYSDVMVTPKMISLQVKFTEPVTVRGKPSIPFSLAGSSRQLVYSSGSGTDALTFSYKPAKEETANAANVNVPTQSISLGSAKITDRAGNAATSLAQPDVRIQWATVRDKGNAADDTGYGAVAYDYRIGAYEITIGQYAAFLNAVARFDTYDLYSVNMTIPAFAGIMRLGLPGEYTYAVMNNGGDSSNRPITFVSWLDAVRFANWMHNGQPTGAQGLSTTEDGAYTINGLRWGTTPTRNPGARFYIPTENEWYKAAYYKGAGTNAGYWDYATQSDTPPGNTIGGLANQANCFDIGSGYAVTGSTSYAFDQNYLTNVGAFTGSASAYGTFDQGGNVVEWNDLAGTPSEARGIRGGSYFSSSVGLSASGRLTEGAWGEANFGFRLASSV